MGWAIQRTHVFPKLCDSWGYICFSKQTPIIHRKALLPCRFQWAVAVGVGGLNDWGLQMRGGLSSLGELANSSMSSSISVLWEMYRFSLWSYWVFLIATIKSSPPPSSWVLHSCSWSISLWYFPLSLLNFLPPVFTDSNYYAQLSTPNFCLRTLGSSW